MGIFSGKLPSLTDLPPFWLAVTLASAWAVDVAFPVAILGPIAQPFGAGVAIAGAVLMAAAIAQMARARTTVIPKNTPQAMVTSGVFALSRNPIYLGDALILLGFVIWHDAPLALPLVALFMILITNRFIRAEEATLATRFGAEFAGYSARTPRWMLFF